MPKSVVKIEISTLSLLKVVALALALWFLYLIKAVIAILFVAIILASAIDPMVNWFRRRNIPRLLSVVIIYIVVLALVSLVIVLLVPPVTHQVANLATDFPSYWNRVSAGVSTLEEYSKNYGLADEVQRSLSQLSVFLSRNSAGVLATLSGIFGGIVSFFIILVITFYLLLEEGALKKVLRFLTPAKYQPYFTQLAGKVGDKIGAWLRGQIVLSAIIALIVFLGLNIAGLFYPIFSKYALVLALLAFLMEFVPYLGPMLAAVPALFIGLTQGLAVMAGVLVGYIIMQWLENNLIVPQVMRRAVGLNPIIVIVSLMIGVRVGGVVGMVLAIPVATALSVIIEEVSRELDQREV
ncbi:AI-2E family transporter [Candidatus Falkowbacteria bacterium]|nr:AI-2E family transporter [Candidatus Falkowbacteria bacterium]